MVLLDLNGRYYKNSKTLFSMINKLMDTVKQSDMMEITTIDLRYTYELSYYNYIKRVNGEYDNQILEPDLVQSINTKIYQEN